MSAVRWLKEMKLYYDGDMPDWRSLLNNPLSGNLHTEEVLLNVEPCAHLRRPIRTPRSVDGGNGISRQARSKSYCSKTKTRLWMLSTASIKNEAECV